ncbi:hypothetical protein GALMADRAFT_215516 [Galerina marginata CBS 339.88]|uniref:Uncharacterized protein n=1 Tax=Galerina marginata (strain CBS 339.88) TaxID=685588 RepID=A0A067SG58_GALM3|nr:hypothetical protein GALMADRAFT_215516 [Galerina marginata CBS 339.88]
MSRSDADKVRLQYNRLAKQKSRKLGEAQSSAFWKAQISQNFESRTCNPNTLGKSEGSDSQDILVDIEDQVSMTTDAEYVSQDWPKGERRCQATLSSEEESIEEEGVRRQAKFRREANLRQEDELRREVGLEQEAELRQEAEYRYQAELRQEAEHRREAELRQEAEHRRDAELRQEAEHRREAELRHEDQLKREEEAAQVKVEKAWKKQQERIAKGQERRRTKQENAKQQRKEQQEARSKRIEEAKMSAIENRQVHFNRYDKSWNELRSGNHLLCKGSLSFSQIPWPILGAGPFRLLDLTEEKINQFITHKERVGSVPDLTTILRTELLRWHSDKFSIAVLPLVMARDAEVVKEGLHLVVVELTAMKMKLRNKMGRRLMTSVTTTMMTEEEGAEIEKQKQMNSNNPKVLSGPSTPVVSDGKDGTSSPTTRKPSTPPAVPTVPIPDVHHNAASGTASGAPPTTATSDASPTSLHIVPHAYGASSPTGTSGTAVAADKEREKQEVACRKAEQRES